MLNVKSFVGQNKNMEISQKVKKKSNKAFKSGLKINTVKNLTINPNTSKLAYTFFEDTSIVDVDKCEIVSTYTN